MRAGLRLLSKRINDKIASPGSSLLNPRSQRHKTRRMMATHEALKEDFEQQALFAGLGNGKTSHLPRSKKQRTVHAIFRTGKDVAEKAKHMTDSEWESVSMDDKHAFTKFMSQQLREHPTETTDQQRRRYFETTMADPRDLDPQKTVRDEYERIKMGLPVQLKNPQRSLGVSQAMYDAADASLFDADNVHKLENAMTHIKQIFADYVRKRREGVTTEAERRQLANLTSELNIETQKHLANMFKYAEVRLRQVTMDERHHQLTEIERIRNSMKGPRQTRNSGNVTRLERLKRVVNRAIGLDLDVAETILTEMQTQENFLQFCEVFARLTLGSGFQHTEKDETLDSYVMSLRKLYSMDAGTLSTLDVVQYNASKEGTHPVDWAKRWYEKALLIPLQNTPEYKKLQNLQEQDLEALKTTKEGTVGDTVARHAESEVARVRAEEVVNIVGKMFLDPSDRRLESLHEKRLCYLAHMQMERQIKRVRENARLFEGVEHTPEAEECRELYRRILERKSMLGSRSKTKTEGELVVENSEPPENELFNVYDDAETADLFEKIRNITLRVIKERRIESRAAVKADRLRRIVHSLKGGEQSVTEELRAMHRERREKITQRLLGIVESDVKAEMEWLQNMEEAERPPLLPIPEGMSYVSAADVQAWREVRDENERQSANPFERRRRFFRPELLGQAWRVPDKPLLFWGTGVTAVQQALRHAAEDAERRRQGVPLAPPYPCPENPWGWRLARDLLDED